MKLTLINPDLYGPGNTLTEEAYKDSQENCFVDRRFCNQFYIPYSDTIRFNDQYFFIQTEIGLAPIAVNYYYICECNVSTTIQILVTDYLVSKNETGMYYVVFKIPYNLPPGCSIFNVIAELDYGTGGKVFYTTQQFYKEPCKQVTLIKACYEGTTGSNVDVNGIYYGWLNDEANSYGNLNLSYKHNYTVRNLSIKNTGRSTKFTATDQKNVTSEITRLSTLNIADEIPSWYADYLQFAFSIGVVQVDYGVEFAVLPLYKLSDITFRSYRECCNSFHVKAIINQVFEIPLPCVQDGICVNCPKPKIEVTPLTSTTIQVEITDNYITTSNYEYTIDGGVTWVVVPSQLFVISGLSSAGYYIIQVRNNCDVESSFSNSVGTTTYHCKKPIITIQNITYYDMVVFINNFESGAGHTYDISFDGGGTWIYTGLTTQSNIVSVTSGTALNVVVRHNCPGGDSLLSNPTSITTATPIYCIEYGDKTYISGGNGVTGTFSCTFTLKDQFGNTIVNTGADINISLVVASVTGDVVYTGQILNGASFGSITYTIWDVSDTLCLSCLLGASFPQDGSMAFPFGCNIPVCNCSNCIFIVDNGSSSPSLVMVKDCCGNIISPIPAPIDLVIDVICGTSGSIGLYNVTIPVGGVTSFGPYSCPGGFGSTAINIVNNPPGYLKCS